eukprot:g3195.t1
MSTAPMNVKFSLLGLLQEYYKKRQKLAPECNTVRNPKQHLQYYEIIQTELPNGKVMNCERTKKVHCHTFTTTIKLENGKVFTGEEEMDYLYAEEAAAKLALTYLLDETNKEKDTLLSSALKNAPSTTIDGGEESATIPLL